MRNRIKISSKLESRIKQPLLKCKHITTRRRRFRYLLRVPNVSNQTLVGRVHDVRNVLDDLVLNRYLLAHIFGNILLLAQYIAQHVHALVLLCAGKKMMLVVSWW